MRSLLQKHWQLISILFLAFFIRILFLDIVPTAIGGDELQYILNAKAFFLTGKDLSSSISLFSPFLFIYPPGILPQAELPYLLYLPIIGLLQFSLLSARITNAILSTGIVFALYIFTKEILGKRVALLAALCCAINPWMVVIGRTVYEVVPAMFFYLCGLSVMVKVKGWKMLFALPFFILGFYSYIATKVVLLAFVLVGCWYNSRLHKQTSRKIYLVLIGICLVMIASYLTLLHVNSSGGRLSEILTPFSPQINQEVNRLRQETIIHPGTGLVENKIVIYFKLVTDKLFSVLSFTYLFVSGDSFFGLWRQGIFYYLDALFLFIGCAALYLSKRREFYLLGTLVLLGIIPQLIHQQSSLFTPHITMAIPFMIIVIAYGIERSIQAAGKKRTRLIVPAGIAIIYCALFGYFYHLYLFEYPFSGTNDFPVRIISHYATFVGKDQPVLIYSHRPEDLFKKYIFYTDSYSNQTAPQIRQAMKSKVFVLGNVSFVGCGELVKDTNKKTVRVSDMLCVSDPKAKPNLLIARFTDSGRLYQIYNDSLCQQYPLANYFRNFSLQDFRVEQKNSKDFCLSLLIKP